MKIKISSLLILVIVLVFAAMPAEAQNSGPIYIVEPGDTLSSIAVRFGTSVEALILANQIADPDRLTPGTELVIPGFEGISGTLVTQKVAYGETLASLSLRHGVSTGMLIRLNRIVNPQRIYVGQSIILPQDGDGSLALPDSRLVLLGPGESLLEVAMREGISPWTIRSRSLTTDRGWVLPGAPLIVAAEQRTTSALPEPILSVELTPQPAVQGHTAGVYVDVSQPSLLEGRLGNWTLHFFELEPGRMVALQGVHAMADPGLYDLEIRMLSPSVDRIAFGFSQPVRVISANYAYDPVLIVPPETLDRSVIEPENQVVTSVVAAASPERLWEGVLQFPSTHTSAFPSRFGSRRNYNNMGYTTYHSGLDFYGAEGEPILAPAPGRVVLARSQTVRGNITIIDHGWGVFTAYLHQSEISVAVGDLVGLGQKIGEVGSTGRVTGPHLHWEVWVGGVPVDPLEWTEVAWP